MVLEREKVRILYVSFIDPEEDGKYGGGHGCSRNFNLLKNIFEIEKYIIQKRNTLGSFLSLLEMHMPPERSYDQRNIIQIIKLEEYDAVWFDSSMHGGIVKKVSCMFPKMKIFAYFHNVECDYVDVRVENKLKNRIYKFLARKQEEMTVQYATIKFVLSKRDENRLKELYGNNNYEIMPVSFKDSYDEKRRIVMKKNTCEGIFVGAYGRANRKSIEWFLKNTSLDKSVTIRVIGKGFENYRKELEEINPNVKIDVVGTVEDISPYYYNADFVLAPIIIGAGMKVKIAEAMMYGKTIIGTKEAFIGYDCDFKKIGICSDNIEELDNGIKRVLNNEFDYKFNSYSRKLFLEKYSTKAIESILNQYV